MGNLAMIFILAFPDTLLRCNGPRVVVSKNWGGILLVNPS